MKKIFLAVLICAGCGGDDSNSDNGFIEGPLPTEQTLCTLVVSQSTVGQVQETLGKPTITSQDANGTQLGYFYAQSNGAVYPNLFLYFDESDILESVPSVSNLPFPSCWRDSSATVDSDSR